MTVDHVDHKAVHPCNQPDNDKFSSSIPHLFSVLRRRDKWFLPRQASSAWLDKAGNPKGHPLDQTCLLDICGIPYDRQIWSNFQHRMTYTDSNQQRLVRDNFQAKELVDKRKFPQDKAGMWHSVIMYQSYPTLKYRWAAHGFVDTRLLRRCSCRLRKSR